MAVRRWQELRRAGPKGEEPDAIAAELRDPARDRIEIKATGVKVEWRKRTRMPRIYPVETVRGKGSVARTVVRSSTPK